MTRFNFRLTFEFIRYFLFILLIQLEQPIMIISIFLHHQIVYKSKCSLRDHFFNIYSHFYRRKRHNLLMSSFKMMTFLSLCVCVCMYLRWYEWKTNIWPIHASATNQKALKIWGSVRILFDLMSRQMAVICLFRLVWIVGASIRLCCYLLIERHKNVIYVENRLLILFALTHVTLFIFLFVL